MSTTKLCYLIVKQHALTLVLVLLAIFGLAVLEGISDNYSWHTEITEKRSEAARFKNNFTQKNKYVPSDENKRSYHSVAEFLEEAPQVYYHRPNSSLGRTRNRLDHGIESLYYLVAAIAGVSLITVARKKYLTEFLQGLGYSGPKIFLSRVAIFGLTTTVAVIIGEAVNALLIYLTIPNQYFKYFTWGHWFGNLISDVLISLVVLLLGVIINTVISNYFVAFIVTAIACIYWPNFWAIIMLSQSDEYKYANYLGNHWQLGMLISVILIVALTLIGLDLSRQYSSELQQQVVTIPWLRPVVFGLFGIFGTLGLGHVIERILVTLPIPVAYLIAMVLVLFILVVWLYRPKWSQRLWELTAELR